MERWSGKIAVVTGAGAGIGAAVVLSLLKADVIVIGLARRVERIEELRKSVDPSRRGNLHAYKCDVSDPQSIKQTFASIENQFKVVNILINNAGTVFQSMILSDEDNLARMDNVIDTNLRGLVHCTRYAYRMMAANNADGHIVNVSSISGHKVVSVSPKPMSNVYSSTKFGVTAAVEVLRQELIYLGNDRVKVSNVSPGLVKTDIIASSGLDPEEVYKQLPHLSAEDIADAIMYILSTPPNVQVHDLIIKPVGERM